VFVRLVGEHRRAGVLYRAGRVLEVREDEAMVLIQDGLAVPLRSPDVFAKESRAE
jgi:hypothetical protein